MKRTPLKRRTPLRRKRPFRSQRNPAEPRNGTTPERRHREAVMEQARRRYEDGERVECGLAFLAGECSGPWQADHVLEVHDMALARSQAVSRMLYGGDPLPGDNLLLAADLATLVADGRNSWGALVCERHHNLKTRKLVDIPRERIPASVEEFARDYGLERLLDREFPRSERPHP